jgi:arylsulfatase A-like enzyme
MIRRPFSWAAWLIDAAAVSVVWAGLLFAENVALGFLWRDQFSGIWEIALSRRAVVPLAAAALAPASLVVVAAWSLACSAAAGGTTPRRVLGAIGVAAATALGFGVTQGRHFAGVGLRATFIAVLAACGWGMATVVAPRIVALRGRPLALAALGLALAAGGWLGDEYMLPRLYPAFHAALFALTLLGAATAAMALRDDQRPPGRLAVGAAVAVAVGLGVGAIAATRALAAFDRATNLRRVLVEHAPLLGRAVALAVEWRASEVDAAPEASAATVPVAEVARSLDWGGHDLVLLTVDALRADHVGAYGYPRATTPNIDGLAREGALFESAYCATPHTSYSVTSTMTGKYLRPLLALGLGRDSETWARDLRRYGWRTAAFYPPAVFFIDEARFTDFEADHLGFEYAKIEFADPALREAQVAAYLEGAPADRPLFLWVHFFEPHEPYVTHPEHPFSGGASADVDAYDSEVATADDGIGRVIRRVHAARSGRPDPIVIVTADHGEEFGEHGGRYHGTTVYEEQVHVPLVIVGPGVRAGARVASVVQTIDLLPTALSALGIPRPARVRGRDLGSLLVGATTAKGGDDGFAFAETDDYALVASGEDRLVCERRAAACELYRPAADPLERQDRGPAEPDRAARLRALLRATERDHGRYETAGAASYPEALRRGMQGESDAAEDVASLLDDADLAVRRKAAEVCFTLHVGATAPEVARAAARDEDDTVRRWAALALVRMGQSAPPAADALLRDPDRDWRRAAALAFGLRGDARACDEIAAEWAEVWPDVPPADADGGDGEPPRLAIDLASAEERLAATAGGRCRSAVPALLHVLEDVRARPYVADALGQLGDDRARAPLLAMMADEPYVTTRPHEARALLALGVHDWVGPSPTAEVHVAVAAPPDRDRLVVLLSDPAAELSATADDAPVSSRVSEGLVRTADLPSRAHGSDARPVQLAVRASSGGVVALWLAAPRHLIDRAGSRK